MIKICAISDTHGQYNFNIDPVNILFICGDIVPLKMQRNIPQSLSWFKNKFIPWCKQQPAEQIYMVAGNHDFFLESSVKEVKECLLGTNITILYDEGAEYLDESTGKIYKIWGSPNCHIFGNWAFMYSDEFNKELYEKMPSNIDFLITHDAPYGRNDILLQSNCRWANGEHIGNISLYQVVKERKPKYHFTGHLHSTDHELKDYDGTQTACVSLLNEDYKMAYKPLYLEIE